MKLAWKEIKYSKSKYFLIESILVLMIFMVIFLSGLANGLARAVSASIENADAKYFVVSNDAENMIPLSSLSNEVMGQVASTTSDKVTNLDIRRAHLTVEGKETKFDITYFAIDPESFLAPRLTEGEAITNSSTEYTIVLNNSFQEEEIEIGDVLEDNASGIKMTVVGFTEGEMYGHSPVGFISADTYTAINKEINPTYDAKYQTLAIQGSNIESINIEGYTVVDKKTIVKSIPSYSAEQTTINMILWVLVVISAAILGVFFYVITIQKLKQFGVLKAIGMDMMHLAGIISSQVFLLALIGVALGNLLAFGMASMLPNSMPFYLKEEMVIIISAVFIIISLFTSLISIRKVAKVDPMVIIGGNE